MTILGLGGGKETVFIRALQYIVVLCCNSCKMLQHNTWCVYSIYVLYETECLSS